jgi:hypothetical protein
MWGTFRNGGIVSCANPTYTTGEFLYQIQMCSQSYKVKAIVVHPDSLQIAQEAAAQAGLPTSCICLIEPPAKGKAAVPTVEDNGLAEGCRHLPLLGHDQHDTGGGESEGITRGREEQDDSCAAVLPYLWPRWCVANQTVPYD